MRKIAVIGDTGAGKSVFAAELSKRLGIKHYDSDAYRFDKGHKRKYQEFLDDVEKITSRDEWMLDSAHTAALPTLGSKADTIFYFRFPARILFYRVVKRALRRLLTGETYADGRKEDWHHLVGKDGWISAFYPRFQEKRRKYEELLQDIDQGEVGFIIFRNPRAVQNYLRDLDEGLR